MVTFICKKSHKLNQTKNLLTTYSLSPLSKIYIINKRHCIVCIISYIRTNKYHRYAQIYINASINTYGFPTSLLLFIYAPIQRSRDSMNGGDMHNTYADTSPKENILKFVSRLIKRTIVPGNKIALMSQSHIFGIRIDWNNPE